MCFPALGAAQPGLCPASLCVVPPSLTRQSVPTSGRVPGTLWNAQDLWRLLSEVSFCWCCASGQWLRAGARRGWGWGSGNSSQVVGGRPQIPEGPGTAQSHAFPRHSTKCRFHVLDRNTLAHVLPMKLTYWRPRLWVVLPQKEARHMHLCFSELHAAIKLGPLFSVE